MRELSMEKLVCITGFLIPWRMQDDVPWLLELEGIKFLPLFSRAEKLRHSMHTAGVMEDDYRIKQIKDGGEFLSSLPAEQRVMLDPWRTERGTTRFTEIKLALLFPSDQPAN